MKGIILAGGIGSRLHPCTAVINKHLLPVYNKPMIYYPIETMVKAGLKEIMIVSGKEHIEQFRNLLTENNDFRGINFNFTIQKEAGGIAHGLGLGQKFAGDDKVMLILGDNIFGDDLKDAVNEFEHEGKGAKLLLKKVNEPEKFEVAITEGNKVISIQDKPLSPKSDLAVTGVYLYDNQVWQVIAGLQPSVRGELEITDVNNFYIKRELMNYEILNKFWLDIDTFATLQLANLQLAKVIGIDLPNLLGKIVSD